MAHILVIDDESNIRMMLRLALQHAGHTVEVAADGYEGLDKFATGDGWNLVLLDQRMPGLDGLEVLREIGRRTSTTRVIMITAFGTIDLATQAMQAGATDFLRKPFTTDILRGAVRAALEGDGKGAKYGASERDQPSPIPYDFDQTTINGYRLKSAPGVQSARNGSVSDLFVVEGAASGVEECRVTLPGYAVELVKAYVDAENVPGGDRFWQALCGEALANHLWQNAELPEGGELIIADLTSGLKHWIDAVLTASASGDAR